MLSISALEVSRANLTYICRVISIEPYTAAHFQQTIQCLQDLQKSKSSYPPADIVTGIQPSTKDWLGEGTAHRFVAVIEGQVAGHISLSEPYPYLSNFFIEKIQGYDEKSYLEVGAFFVSPEFQKHGVGSKLFEHVINESEKLSKTPALVVVESYDSHKAISLYKRHGMTSIGLFIGTHGKNIVFLKEV